MSFRLLDWKLQRPSQLSSATRKLRVACRRCAKVGFVGLSQTWLSA